MKRVTVSGGFTVEGVTAINIEAQFSSWMGTPPSAGTRRSGGSFTTQASIANTNFAGGNFTHATFANVDATGTDFSGADLSHATMAYIDLTGADLSGADISSTNLTGSILTNSDLSGANLPTEATQMEGTILAGVTLTNADIGGTDMSQSSLEGLSSGQTVRYTAAQTPTLSMLPLGWVLTGQSTGDGPFNTAHLVKCAPRCIATDPSCSCSQYAATDCEGINQDFSDATGYLQCLFSKPIDCTTGRSLYRARCCGLSSNTLITDHAISQTPLSTSPLSCDQLSTKLSTECQTCPSLSLLTAYMNA